MKGKKAWQDWESEMTSNLDMELIRDRKKGDKDNEIDRNLTNLVSGTHTHPTK